LQTISLHPDQIQELAVLILISSALARSIMEHDAQCDFLPGLPCVASAGVQLAPPPCCLPAMLPSFSLGRVLVASLLRGGLRATCHRCCRGDATDEGCRDPDSVCGWRQICSRCVGPTSMKSATGSRCSCTVSSSTSAGRIPVHTARVVDPASSSALAFHAWPRHGRPCGGTCCRAC